MKSLLSPLRRIIFLSFILFTVFAGEKSGCRCGDSSSSNSSQSSQGNSNKGQSGHTGSSSGGSSVQSKRNPSNQSLNQGKNSQNGSLQPLNHSGTTAYSSAPKTLSAFETPHSHSGHSDSENEDSSSMTQEDEIKSLFQISDDQYEDYKNLRKGISQWINEEDHSKRIANFNFSESTDLELLVKVIIDSIWGNSLWEDVRSKNFEKNSVSSRYLSLFSIMLSKESKVISRGKFTPLFESYKDKKNGVEKLFLDVLNIFSSLSQRTDYVTSDCIKSMKTLIDDIEILMSTFYSKNSSSSGPQNSKNSMLQVRKHFQSIFNKVTKILMEDPQEYFINLIEMLLSQDPMSGVISYDQIVLAIYAAYKVDKDEFDQKIKNWIQNHQKSFLEKFTSLNHRLTLEIDNFTIFLSYFGLVCSFDLENEKITECVNFILSKKEIKTDTNAHSLLSFKLSLLELTKNCFKIHQSVEQHFYNNFKHYVDLLNDEFHPLWTTDKGIISGLTLKLRLANTLEKLNPENWKKENLEKRVFRKDKNFLSVNDPLVRIQLQQRLIELHLWQELNSGENSLFDQFYSENHLEFLKNWILDKKQSQDPALALTIALYPPHESLNALVEQWTEILKKIPNDKVKTILIILMGMIHFETAFLSL